MDFIQANSFEIHRGRRNAIWDTREGTPSWSGISDLSPYDRELYMKALKDGKEKDKSIRINVVGNFNQGKTTVVKRLLGLTIGDVKSTDGIDINRYKCNQQYDGEIQFVRKSLSADEDFAKRMAMVARSTELQEKSGKSGKSQRAILRLFSEGNSKKGSKMSKTETEKFNHSPEEKSNMSLKESNVDEPVFPSNTDTKVFSFESLQGSVEEETDSEEDVDFERQIVLSDHDSELFRNEMKRVRKSSAVQTISYDVWDFGGQYVFYATHTLFHSTRAIYLLVFNLAHELNDVVVEDDDECQVSMGDRSMEYYIRFWVNSVHSFAGNADSTEPIIILVGTHIDKLQGDDAKKLKQANAYFDKVRALFKGRPTVKHIYCQDFSLDNTMCSNDQLDALRAGILSAAEECSTGFEIPAKWIQLEKALRKRNHKRIVKLKEIMEVNSKTDYPLANMEQVKFFLRYHHDKGTLFYFDEEPISDYVVLDPQFLIDAFKCIVTAERFKRNARNIQEYWTKLKDEARLETPLINALWGSDANKGFMEHKGTILWFLIKHCILSEAMLYDEEKQSSVALGWYVIPSLLRDPCRTGDIHDFVSERKQTKVEFVLSFDNSSIIHILYHRLTAALLGKWAISEFRGEKLLFQTLSVLRLDFHHFGICEMHDSHISLRVVSRCPSQDVQPVVSDKYRRYVESVVMHEFRKHRRVKEVQALPYVRCFSCNHESHTVGKKVVKIEQLESEAIIPCPDNEPHEINAAFAKSEWYQRDEALLSAPTGRTCDKTLSRLSQVIGKNWQLLAPHLGVSRVMIDHICEDFPNSASMKIYKMLQHWRDTFDTDASVDCLVKVLRQNASVSVDWDGIRNLIEDLNTKERSVSV